MDENANLGQQGQQAAEQVMPPEKKPKRWPLVVFAILFFAVLVGVGVYIWQNNRVAEEEKKEVKTVTVVQANASEVTDKVKAKLAGAYEIVNLDQNNQPTKSQVAVRVAEDSPLYQTKGFKYYNDYDGGSTMTIVTNQPTNSGVQLPSPADVSVRDAVIKVYTDYGLTKTGSRGQTSDGTGVDVYEGKGLVCTVETPQSAISSTNASCGVITKYTKAAAQFKPFADQMGDIESTTILANLKTTDSKVRGYQWASLGRGDINAGGGAAVLFYRKTGESWKLFKTTQEVLLCSDYNTVDLKNAFNGEKCYDEATNPSDAVVQ